MTQQAIENWLADRIATHASIPREKIDLDGPPESFGLDSLSAVTILADLGDMLLGRELQPDRLWAAPSLRALCAELAQEAAQR